MYSIEVGSMFISRMPTSDFAYILLESTEAFANLYGMQDTGNSTVEFVNRGFKGVPPTVFLPNWHDIVWSRTNRVFSRVWRVTPRDSSGFRASYRKIVLVSTMSLTRNHFSYQKIAFLLSILQHTTIPVFIIDEGRALFKFESIHWNK